MDIFADEQLVYDNAIDHITAVCNGEPYDFEEYKKLAKEYRSLLKQLRRVTKISDKTTVDLHEINLDLTDKVHFDTLTGIYNRRYMEENIQKNIKALSRSGGVMSIMIMDIDFFKKYNDTYGHSAGDNCLRLVAKTLADCVTRAFDFVARYGGEEFVVVLPNTDEKGAEIIAGNILKAVMNLGIPHEKNEAASCVTISIGSTTIQVEHTDKYTDYIKRADIALYKSKQTGRNRYTQIKYKENNNES